MVLVSAGMVLIHELIRERDGAMLAFLQPRPSYCNRGRWSAHVEAVPPEREGPASLTAGGHDFFVSENDWWPRYYFSLDVAKSEIASWLEAHGVDVAGATWREVAR